MASRDRINLFPSTANLVFIKQRIASAKTGLGLLKRKRDALEIYSRQLSRELTLQREQLDASMKAAIFSMAKAKFLGTDFKPALVVNPNLADVYLGVTNKKIIGLKVPTLELMMQQSNAMNFTGLARGGQQVQIVREKYQAALKVIVTVASLEYSIATISAAIKQNNRRVNGLEYVLLPRYQNTMIFIRDELDELGREEFYRLKRSQAKQKKKKTEFVKYLDRNRGEDDNVQQAIADFPHTDLQTAVEINFSARPKGSIQGPRKTVAKIRHKTNVVETKEQKPIVFNEQLREVLPKKSVSIQTPEEITSSSSSDSSD